MKHSIIVGNIGTVYDGNNKQEAEETYDCYCNMSMSGYGRASGEPVVWFIDNELYMEYEY